MSPDRNASTHVQIPLQPTPGLTVVLAATLLSLLAAGSASAQTGACCASCDLAECVITTQAECETFLGSYAGDGTTCDDCGLVTVPEPSLCTVVPADALNGLFVAPDAPGPIPASVIVVSAIDNCGHQVPGAAVTVLLTDDNPTCGMDGLVGTTNPQGEAIVRLSASGCLAGEPLAGVIKVNGVTIRAYANVKSPDADGNGRVELGDLVDFSNEFLGVDASGCHDYDNDGVTALPDLVLFSPAFVAGNHCP